MKKLTICQPMCRHTPTCKSYSYFNIHMWQKPSLSISPFNKTLPCVSSVDQHCGSLQDHIRLIKDNTKYSEVKRFWISPIGTHYTLRIPHHNILPIFPLGTKWNWRISHTHTCGDQTWNEPYNHQQKKVLIGSIMEQFQQRRISSYWSIEE